MKALIVEDHKDVIDTIVLCLQMRWPSVEITSLDRGAKALETAVMQKPDLIVLDLGLPDIDGIKVMEGLRSTLTTSTIPVIIVTARHGEGSRVKGLESGADDYIEKPFSHTEFLARVNALMRRVRMNKKEPESEFARFGRLIVDLEGRRVWLDSNPVNLTATGVEYP